MNRLSTASFTSLVVLVTFIAGVNRSQAQFDGIGRSLTLPSRSFVYGTDATALAMHPAALGTLDTWTLMVAHRAMTQNELGDAVTPGGEGFYAAMPLLFGLSAGASVERLRGTYERTNVSLGLAYSFTDALTLGVSPRWVFGDGRLSDGFSVDLSLLWQMSPNLAAALAVRDINQPDFGPVSAARSYLGGLSVRPLGDRRLGLEVSAAVSEGGEVLLRGQTEVLIPRVGYLAAGVEWNQVSSRAPNLSWSISLLSPIEGFTAEAGVMGGSDGPLGSVVAAGLSGTARPEVFFQDINADVRVSASSARDFVSLLLRLERAASDSRVRGVLLRMRGGLSSAEAQELRMAVTMLRQAGKRTACILEDASGSEFYACRPAEVVAVDRAGGIRLVGPSLEVMHFADLLRNIGVRADFVRIGEFKSAIEDFQDQTMSSSARTQRQEFLSGLMRRITFDLGQDLSASPEAITTLISNGPYVADEAMANGLIDEVIDEVGEDPPLESPDAESVGDGPSGDNQANSPLADLLGSRPTESREDRRSFPAWSEPTRIGVVVIDGDIVDGENQDVPLLDIHTSGGRTITTAIDQLAADPSVVAIVVRIDSGGGSVLASDQIWRAIRRARRRKPVIASLGSVAASGGYYIASAAQEIWAAPSTLTGSIGVWFGKVDFAPLLTRIGVSTEQLRMTPHGGVESLFRPFTARERAMLAGKVRRWYGLFLERVARGRGMSLEAVDRLARGRVYSGDRAHEVGLVDHLGSVLSAINRARQLAHVGASCPVVIAPRRPQSLLDYATSSLGLAGAGEAQAGLGVLSPEIMRVLRAVYVMSQAQGVEPLMRVPFDLVEG